MAALVPMFSRCSDVRICHFLDDFLTFRAVSEVGLFLLG